MRRRRATPSPPDRRRPALTALRAVHRRRRPRVRDAVLAPAAAIEIPLDMAREQPITFDELVRLVGPVCRRAHDLAEHTSAMVTDLDCVAEVVNSLVRQRQLGRITHLPASWELALIALERRLRDPDWQLSEDRSVLVGPSVGGSAGQFGSVGGRAVRSGLGPNRVRHGAPVLNHLLRVGMADRPAVKVA